MISKNELFELAKIKGLPPRLAEADYLQDVALFSACREFGKSLVFKGGTCLYKLFQLNRFSEDLDFSAQKGFAPRDFFQKKLPYFFNLLGIKSSVKAESYERSLNASLQIAGPLYDGRKETMAHLQFNISLRERVCLPPSGTLYAPSQRELRSFSIFAMDEREILAEKIRAIYSRNKARDVYDLWFLLKARKAEPNIAMANKKLSTIQLKFEKSVFLAKIEEKRNGWGKDLSALIFGELPSFSQVKKEIEMSL
jgi:predicted nucleotidyltransferase component of viral defense system